MQVVNAVHLQDSANADGRMIMIGWYSLYLNICSATQVGPGIPIIKLAFVKDEEDSGKIPYIKIRGISLTHMHVCTRTHKPFNVLLKICYSQNINIVV
jgi:hypothetical protein